ncbi:MAG: PorT family protein [Bacteroidales bacterium]|nr:PorT family protein [Bacteroidales bacterium]
MSRTLKILSIIIALATVIPLSAGSPRLNNKIQNRPYADLRPWHLGFSVGLHTQDIRFAHNGLVTEEGETWFMEQPAFSPGFCVNGLFDLRLNDYFSVRFTPGMYFGNREISMINTSATEDAVGPEARIKQNLKSTLVVLPLDIKFAAQRFRNCRPYLVGGVMPTIDVSKKRPDYIKLKSTDVFLEVGFGCDFYLPYFKFNPEIKFCFGLADALTHRRPDLVDDPGMMKITNSLKRATSQMVVLTFYFE